MTHPIHADDEVGKVTGELTPLALQFATALMAASRHGDRAKRAAALDKAFETWPALARRMPLLEAAAPNAFNRGFEADASRMDRLEAFQARGSVSPPNP